MNSSEQPRLILHIGLSKTGTTTIQNFLRLNGEVLSSLGLTPIVEVGGFLRAWPTIQYPEPRPFGMVWRPVLDLTRRAGTSVLVSDENFAELFCEAPERITEVQRAFPGHRVQVVVYLRRQDLHFESLYKQLVKGHRVSAEIDVDRAVAYAPSSRFLGQIDYTYDRWLDALADYLGLENVIVRVFEKNRFTGGDLLLDFIEAVGLSWSDRFRPLVVKSNISLTSKAVSLCRKANGLLDNGMGGHVSAMDQRLFAANMIGVGKVLGWDGRQGLLSCEARQRLLDVFEASNRRVAERFFNSAGPLFEPPVHSAPEPKTRLTREELEVVCIILHKIWCERVQDMDYCLVNFLRLRKAQADVKRGVHGAKRELFLYKLINSLGKRFVRGWPKDTGQLEMRLQDVSNGADLDAISKRLNLD